MEDVKIVLEIDFLCEQKSDEEPGEVQQIFDPK